MFNINTIFLVKNKKIISITFNLILTSFKICLLWVRRYCQFTDNILKYRLQYLQKYLLNYLLKYLLKYLPKYYPNTRNIIFEFILKHTFIFYFLYTVHTDRIYFHHFFDYLLLLSDIDTQKTWSCSIPQNLPDIGPKQ